MVWLFMVQDSEAKGSNTDPLSACALAIFEHRYQITNFAQGSRFFNGLAIARTSIECCLFWDVVRLPVKGCVAVRLYR